MAHDHDTDLYDSEQKHLSHLMSQMASSNKNIQRSPRRKRACLLDASSMSLCFVQEELRTLYIEEQEFMYDPTVRTEAIEFGNLWNVRTRINERHQKSNNTAQISDKIKDEV